MIIQSWPKWEIFILGFIFFFSFNIYFDEVSYFSVALMRQHLTFVELLKCLLVRVNLKDKLVSINSNLFNEKNSRSFCSFIGNYKNNIYDFKFYFFLQLWKFYKMRKNFVGKIRRKIILVLLIVNDFKNCLRND